MKKIIGLTILISGLLVVYFFFFTEEELKARKVLQGFDHIKLGMSSADVRKAVGVPDTTYYYDSGIVLQYYQGFGAPDVLRVLIKNDTVANLISNN